MQNLESCDWLVRCRSLPLALIIQYVFDPWKALLWICQCNVQSTLESNNVLATWKLSVPFCLSKTISACGLPLFLHYPHVEVWDLSVRGNTRMHEARVVVDRFLGDAVGLELSKQCNGPLGVLSGLNGHSARHSQFFWVQQSVSKRSGLFLDSTFHWWPWPNRRTPELCARSYMNLSEELLAREERTHCI